jgi:hypothetical protein
MKKLLVVFIIALVATLIAELAVYPEKHFGVGGIPFFYALIGFFSCFTIVFIAKIVEFFLKRKENYYKEVRHDG